MVAPGGTLIFCTCSLEPSEGEDQIEIFLTNHTGFKRAPLTPDEFPNLAEFITTAGDLRTLPCHWQDKGGLDGFYAARLVKVANG